MAVKEKENKPKQLNIRIPDDYFKALSLIKMHYRKSFKEIMMDWIKSEYNFLRKKGFLKELGIE